MCNKRNPVVQKKTGIDEKDQENPSILNPLLRDAMVKIANLLDPASFLRLSETCRFLHDFCLQTKGIRIPYEKANFVARVVAGGKFRFSRGGLAIDSNFCRMPFCFRIASFSFPTHLQMDTDFFAGARSFLKEIRASSITCINVDCVVTDWKAMALFVSDYDVQEMWYYPSRVPRSPMEAASPLPSLRCSAEAFFKNACVAKVYTSMIVMSKDSLQMVIEKWASGNGNIRRWDLKTSMDECSLSLCFSNLVTADYDSPEIPAARPIVLIRKERGEHWILRSDGSVLCCKYKERKRDEVVSSLSLHNDDSSFSPKALAMPILDFSLDEYDFGSIEFAFANLP